jgi:hypothetical protein
MAREKDHHTSLGSGFRMFLQTAGRERLRVSRQGDFTTRCQISNFFTCYFSSFPMRWRISGNNTRCLPHPGRAISLQKWESPTQGTREPSYRLSSPRTLPSLFRFQEKSHVWLSGPENMRRNSLILLLGLALSRNLSWRRRSGPSMGLPTGRSSLIG